MNIQEWKGIIEGALFLSGEQGIELKELAKMIDVSEDTVSCILEELSMDYECEQRGFVLTRMLNSFYLTTKKEHAAYYQKLFASQSQSVLSQSALETLAIVAYNQPITRMEIEEIRGVKTDRPLQSLVTKMLICEVGRADGPGRPILYGTTREFLQYFGIQTLEELPNLPDLMQETDIEDEADLFLSNIRDLEE